MEDVGIGVGPPRYMKRIHSGRWRQRALGGWVALLLLTAGFLGTPSSHARSVVFHEIAWMGTSASSDDQWLELYNTTDTPISIQGWLLTSTCGTVSNRLSGLLQPRQTFLMAATGDTHFIGLPIHQRLRQPLPADGGLRLLDARGRLVDSVPRWHAGSREQAATMQRVYPYTAGRNRASWKTSTIRYDYGYGTPGFRRPPSYTEQVLNQVYHDVGTINVYFNQHALTDWATEGNEANHRINLEEQIIERIRQARHRIDVALYEINLPAIVEALLDRAAEGVEVRLLIDAKRDLEGYRNRRYNLMRVYLEQLARGRDGIIGSPDSVHLFANSPIFAVTNPELREQFGLPPYPGTGLTRHTLNIGSDSQSGYLLVPGAKREPGVHFGTSGQMHNKFVIIDDYRVITGSMNFTETGIYGTRRNREAGIVNGNSNNMLDIHSPELAVIYRDEFNLMWGSDTVQPSPADAKFRAAKPEADPHYLQIGDAEVKVFFSPGYNVIEAITDWVEREADEAIYFSIFAWSDSNLENAIKRKWEGSGRDLEGERTPFIVKGVFERLFWNQWWSANLNMEGRTAPKVSHNNPNIRWREPPPIFRDQEPRKLHHKYMIIDPDTHRNPTVITGSANWSRNANEINDENTLFIHDARIANQYRQEFYARYLQAGGTPRSPPEPTRIAQPKRH